MGGGGDGIGGDVEDDDGHLSKFSLLRCNFQYEDPVPLYSRTRSSW